MEIWKPKLEHSFLAITTLINKMELWHLRMGHLTTTDLKCLKSLSIGMDFTGKEQVQFCESCFRAKMASLPFKNVGLKAERLISTLMLILLVHFLLLLQRDMNLLSC